MSSRAYSTLNAPGYASAPAVGIAGDLYYDTALGAFRVSSGSAWSSLMANPMTTLGDIITGGASGAPARLPGDTSNANRFLRSVSSGGVAAAPTWAALVAGDIPANDTITATAIGATAALWGTITTGSIAIGAGLTTGALNLAASGTGATPITIGHTNAIISMVGTVGITGSITADGVSATAPTTSAIPLAVNGLVGQSASLQVWQVNAVSVATMSASGSLTLNGPLLAPAATTSIPSIRLPHGAAPSAPTNGDVWTTTAGMYVRVNGVTIGPLAAAGGATISDTAPGSPTAGQFWFESDTGALHVYYDSFWIEVGNPGLVSTSGGGAAWGSITGTLSSQTDLQSALDLKAALAGATFTGAIVLAAGTTSLAPLKFTTGVNLTSAVQGSTEWDGDNLFITADTTNGPGRQVSVAAQRVYLASAGSAITAGTDFFPSLRPAIKASKLVHFKYWLMFTKNTAGTVTFQLKNSAAVNFTFMQATMQLFTQASGAFAAVGDMAIAYAAAAATATFPATKSLSSATNYAVLIEGWCVAASNTRLSIAPSAYGAGTITTIVGSTMWCEDLGTYNTNYGNLG